MPVSIRLILLGDMPSLLATSAPDSPACSRSTRSSAATCRERTEVCGLPGRGKGPVSIVVRMPDVLIIDSRGRHILVAPEQARLVSTQMGCVADWIDDCMGD